MKTSTSGVRSSETSHPILASTSPDRCRVRLVVDAKDRVNYLQFDVSKFDGTGYYAP